MKITIFIALVAAIVLIDIGYQSAMKKSRELRNTKHKPERKGEANTKLKYVVPETNGEANVTLKYVVPETKGEANAKLKYVVPETKREVNAKLKYVMPETKGEANATLKYVVPNIAHFTWYMEKPKPILFHHLLSILSVHRIMKADEIYFHCDYEPIGKYWEEARRKVPNLTIVKVNPPKKMFGFNLIGPQNDAIVSDLDRLRIVRQFGGLYLDLDVLILKSLDPLRKYPTTLG